MSVASVSVERGCLRLLLNRARSRYRYRPRFSLFFLASLGYVWGMTLHGAPKAGSPGSTELHPTKPRALASPER